MFFPFNNYKKVNVPQTNGNGTILYTTTATSLIYFVPRGSNMESDSPVGIYVEAQYVDTDGQSVDPWIFYSHDALVSTNNSNQVTGNAFKGARTGVGTYLNISSIVPSGKNLRALIGDSSDRIGGTFHIFEIEEDALV